MGKTHKKWHSSRIIIFGFLVIIATIASCQKPLQYEDPKYPDSPLSMIVGKQPLNEGSGQNLVEVHHIDLGEGTGPVVALKHIPNSTVLLSLQVGNGGLTRWDLEENEMLNTFNTGVISSLSAMFTDLGDRFVGAKIHDFTKPNDSMNITEHIASVMVWDTATGDRVYCIESPCLDSPASNEYLATVLGVAIDPEGRMAIAYNEHAITLMDLTDETSTEIVLVSDPEQFPIPITSKVAFSHNGDQYAIAFLDGKVEVRPVRSGSFSTFLDLITRGKDSNKEILATRALVFSDDDKLLAQIRGDTLIIWDLRRFLRSPLFEEIIPEARLLAFDRSGSYLYIGTDEKIILLDIEKLDTIANYNTTDIMALSVNHDNHLLLWGDSLGNVHILANDLGDD